jgi:MFS family permease
MFGQVLSMHSFTTASGVTGIQNPTLSGLLTSILELGAWVGVLANGILADRLGRKLCVVVACFFFCIGVIVQACTHGSSYSYILGGRFITGLGVGSLSMIVPLYNAELSPPEVRGSMVALQQLAITFGIMVRSFIYLLFLNWFHLLATRRFHTGSHMGPISLEELVQDRAKQLGSFPSQSRLCPH